METEDRIKGQKELIEVISRLYEKQGFGLIPGRILGLLSVMDKEQFTFDEIVEELKISKSSASNALKILEARNFIEYITIPSDRKRYFQIRKQDKFAIIDDHHVRLKASRDLFQEILDLKGDKNSGNAIFYKDIISLMTLFLERFEQIKKEYLENQ